MARKAAKDSLHLKHIHEYVQACEALRRDPESPEDVSFEEYLKNGHNGLSLAQLYDDVGVDPARDTIQNLINLPDFNYKWLIPEIFRNALRLGLRKNPIYPSLIAAEQNVPQTSVTMPAINMSEAAPRKVGVAETIMLGSVSFDQKSVKIAKLGRGIKIPYEVRQYVALNVVNIFFQDFGVQLGLGLDSLAISTLLNGDQANGSDSVSVIGIGNTTTGITYKDLLKVWVRMARLGKNMTTMIGGEDMAIDVLDLLTTTRLFGTPRATVDIKTPIPTNSDFFVHGGVSTDNILLVDKSSALIKLNAQPLLVESDKIISSQVEETYASLTTGFATVYRDSRIVIDRTKLFSGFPFPTWMDPTSREMVTFQ